jgi:hypothetical protein
MKEDLKEVGRIMVALTPVWIFLFIYIIRNCK